MSATIADARRDARYAREEAAARPFWKDKARMLAATYADLRAAGDYTIGNMIAVAAAPGNSLYGDDPLMRQQFADSGSTMAALLAQPFRGETGAVTVVVEDTMPKRRPETIARIEAALEIEDGARLAYAAAIDALFGEGFDELDWKERNALLDDLAARTAAGAALSQAEIARNEAWTAYQAAMAATRSAAKEPDPAATLRKKLVAAERRIGAATESLLGPMPALRDKAAFEAYCDRFGGINKRLASQAPQTEAERAYAEAMAESRRLQEALAQAERAGEEKVVFSETLQAPTNAEAMQAAWRVTEKLFHERRRRQYDRSFYFEGFERRADGSYEVVWGT